MNDSMAEAKKSAAQIAIALVEEGMLVGLGTGSTAYFVIEGLGLRIQQGFRVEAVASSVASEELARTMNIPLVNLSTYRQPDLYIDGADEVDENFNLIKGGGGALTREKILAVNSKRFIVIVDETKLVKTLGRFPLAVEILPFGAAMTLARLEALGCKASIRMMAGRPFVSDNGNFIADCRFETIESPEALNPLIHFIPGVVENGLFSFQLVHQLIAGFRDGTARTIYGPVQR